MARIGWGLGVCALFLAALVPCRTALADDRLRFWLVFNVPAASPGSPEPALDEFLEDWARQGVDLFGLRAKAAENREFRQQLFGQEPILREVALFRAANPTFPRIEVLFFGWDEYWESLRSASPALRPDLIQVPSSWCSSLAEGLGILVPLPETTHEEALRRYDRKLLEPCLVYGDPPLWGLPWMVDVRLLYFWRADLPSLEQEMRNSRDPRDSFRRSLRSAADVGHPLFALPTARDWELLHQTALLVWGHGGELIETSRWLGYRGRSATLKGPALRGAEYLRGLAGDRLIALPRETRQELEQKFVAHQLGSVISGPWLLSELEGRRGAISDGSVGVMLPPFYANDPVTFVGGSLLGVTATNPALRERALELAWHLSAGGGSLPTSMAAGLVPASNKARGTASEAVRRQEELTPRRACSTYFECISPNANAAAVSETLERALRTGRTYPAVPDWWTLEVPSRLGSLYHFWQELAALQPSESLEGNLQAISEDWDASLRGHRRWVLGIGIALVVALLFLLAGALWARRYRARLMKRGEEISASISFLRSQVALEREREARAAQQGTLNLLERILIEVMQKHDELTTPRKYVQGKIGDLVTPLQEPNRFEIILPTRSDRQLRVIKNGRVLAEVDSMPAQIIERVVRQSLLEERPVAFSLLLGALYFWRTRESLPKNPRARWEVLVSEMRDAFKSGRWEVISKGKGTIHDFLLDETSYECYLGAATGHEAEPGRRFVTSVRAPYLEAERLARSDLPAALVRALDAFAAAQDLVTKDVEVTIMACELGARAPGMLSEEQQSTLREAREELSRMRERYDVFFGSYASPDDVVHPTTVDFKRHQRELQAHWDRLRDTWLRIKEAAGSIPAEVAAPPEEIAEAWWTARQRLETLGVDRAQRDTEFVDAYEKILSYWAPIVARGALGRLTGWTARLDPAGKRRRRFQSWAATEWLPSVLMAALQKGEGSDRVYVLSALEAQLAADFWNALDDGRPHILLEILSGGDEVRESSIREELRRRTGPHDIHACIQVLAEFTGAPT